MAIDPQNWSDAGLDTATLADSAPIVAIFSALGERFAAAGNPAVGYALAAPPYVAPRPGAGISADIALRIAASIRALQAFFVNPSTPYADTGYNQWPDLEASSYLDPQGGVGPYDALAILPPPCGPIPGDTATSAGARAFYAWSRAVLDRMVRTVVDVSFADDGWRASGSFGSVGEMLDAAVQGSGRRTMSAHFNKDYGPLHDVNEWTYYESCGSISCSNATDLAAVGSVVVRSPWPLGEDAVGVNAQFWSGGIASAPGVLSGVQVAAHSAATILSSPGKVAPPSPSGSPQDDFFCSFRGFLDFSSSFRFHA